MTDRRVSRTPSAIDANISHMPLTADRALQAAPYVLLSVTALWVAEHAWGPLKDPDSWWHLRLGEDFLKERSLSPPEHWSSFATSKWVPTQPLPEVVSALVNRAGGLPALVFLYVAVVVTLVIGVFMVTRTQASPLPAAVATLLFVAAGEAALTPRPQLLSYALLLVTVAAWLRTEQDLWPRWWLVPMSWFWSMCHGFWFLGVGVGVLGVVAIALGQRATARQIFWLCTVPITSGCVVLLNPVGPRLFTAPFVVSARGQYITEWQRASLTSGPTLTVIIMIAICTFVWCRWRHDATWLKIMIGLVALVLSVYAVRTVVLAALLMAPLVASALQALVTGTQSPRDGWQPQAGASTREKRLLAGGVAVVLALAGVVVTHDARLPGGVPLAFNGPLDRLPAGTTVFNDFTLGGWLSWRHPDLNRWVDGLADAYPVSHLSDTATVMYQETGWRRVVASSGATIAILEQGSAAELGFENAGWRPLASDRGWVLLQKQR